MIISGMFNMISKAKDFYSEIPGRSFLEKMDTIFERLNEPTPQAALKRVKATVPHPLQRGLNN